MTKHHTAVIEYESNGKQKAPVKVTVDGQELDCTAEGPAIEIASADPSAASFLTLTIPLSRFELRNYLPDGSSVEWEQGTDPTDFEEDPT